MQSDAPLQTPTPTYKDLLRAMDALEAQAAALREQVAAARAAERGAAIERIHRLMTAHGITPHDLRDPPAAAADATDAPAAAPAPAAPPKLLFTAKYRDKETGNAWSGNGDTPSWLKRALAEGRSLDEFRV